MAFVAGGHTEFCSFLCIWGFKVYTNLKVLYRHFCSLVDYNNQSGTKELIQHSVPWGAGGRTGSNYSTTSSVPPVLALSWPLHTELQVQPRAPEGCKTTVGPCSPQEMAMSPLISFSGCNPEVNSLSLPIINVNLFTVTFKVLQRANRQSQTFVSAAPLRGNEAENNEDKSYCILLLWLAWAWNLN